jgi:hypothetical protein
MKRKRRGKPATGQDSRAREGAADTGIPLRPTDLPEDESAQAVHDRPRGAPAPGVPIPVEEYERRKREAETAPTPDEAPAQDDRCRSEEEER